MAGKASQSGICWWGSDAMQDKGKKTKLKSFNKKLEESSL